VTAQRVSALAIQLPTGEQARLERTAFGAQSHLAAMYSAQGKIVDDQTEILAVARERSLYQDEAVLETCVYESLAGSRVELETE